EAAAGVLVRAAEALHTAVEGDPHRDRDRTHGPAPLRACGPPAAALSPLHERPPAKSTPARARLRMHVASHRGCTHGAEQPLDLVEGGGVVVVWDRAEPRRCQAPGRPRPPGKVATVAIGDSQFRILHAGTQLLALPCRGRAGDVSVVQAVAPA